MTQGGGETPLNTPLILPSPHLHPFPLLSVFLPQSSVWLSVLRGTVDVEEDQVDYEVTLAGAEMWEHLYHNHTPHINLITRPISMCPVSLVYNNVTDGRLLFFFCLLSIRLFNSRETSSTRLRSLASSSEFIPVQIVLIK